MREDPYKDIPVLVPEFRELEFNSRLMLKDKEGKIIGQLYTSDIKYEKPVKERGRIWISVFSDGDSVLSGLSI